jgi:DNA repair protein RecO (recombination protein O)
MQIKTKAIVLTSLKYGEADLIVKCLTEEGMKSYMLRSILKTKSKKLKPGYFQPLSQLDISAVHNNKGNLNSIREVRVAYLYQTIASNIYKQSIALFLAEVLAYALREEERNATLFSYIQTSLIWLDENKDFANFHLVFLVGLTKYLGFAPDAKNKTADYFDLEEGYFTNFRPSRNYVSGRELILFRLLIGTKFDDMLGLKWNSGDRQAMLEVLLLYFEFHLPGFKKPRSLKVLKEVFNEIS